MQNKFSYHIIFAIMTVLLISLSSCGEEEIWLTYEGASNQIVLRDSSITPMTNVKNLLKENGIKVLAVRMSCATGKCACTKRKNGSCMCRLPNNKRYKCGEAEETCSAEKIVKVSVEPEYVDKTKALGFK